jgi:hypothetical protein
MRVCQPGAGGFEVVDDLQREAQGDKLLDGSFLGSSLAPANHLALANQVGVYDGTANEILPRPDAESSNRNAKRN